MQVAAMRGYTQVVQLYAPRTAHALHTRCMLQLSVESCSAACVLCARCAVLAQIFNEKWHRQPSRVRIRFHFERSLVSRVLVSRDSYVRLSREIQDTSCYSDAMDGLHVQPSCMERRVSV